MDDLGRKTTLTVSCDQSHQERVDPATHEEQGAGSKESKMTTSPTIRTLAMALASTMILLAVSLPAAAQENPPGQIQVYADEHDGETATADFYVVNNTRQTLFVTPDSAWPFSGFESEAVVNPWGVAASTGVDLSEQHGGKFITFDIEVGAPSYAMKFDLVNVTDAHDKLVFWQLTDDAVYPENWVITGDANPLTDPRTGACTYTTEWSTAIANQDFAITLTLAFGNDKESTKVRSKVILMVSEISPSAQVTYQGCQAF